MEHINTIEIKNFKSIHHQRIEGCKRINVFVGPPNVGKSNVLEALSLFCLNKDTSFKDHIRVAEAPTLFFDGLLENDIEVTVNELHKLSARFQNGSRIVVNYQYLNSALGYKKEFGKQGIYDNLIVHSPVPHLQSLTYEDFILLRENSSLLIDEKLEEKKSNELKQRVLRIKKYQFKSDKIESTNSFGTLTTPFGNNLFDLIKTNKELNDFVKGLIKIYGLEMLFDTRLQSFHVMKQTSLGVFSIPYKMLADTLQRLIFYKAAIVTNKESVLLLEEPEANCYEPYIMEITNAIKRDENNNQFFIVTHSQYVIDELLRDKESRKNTNIYLVGLDNSETVIKLLDNETSKEVYESGLNVFFNFDTLWNETITA